MTARLLRVNGQGAESVLKAKLTLSAVVARAQRPDETESAPAEAAVRDERDPYIETELELRFAWGDR